MSSNIPANQGHLGESEHRWPVAGAVCCGVVAYWAGVEASHVNWPKENTGAHLATWKVVNFISDQHLCADEPNSLNFWIKQENGTKHTGTQGASQSSGSWRMQGAFSKAVEKEATFRRKEKERLTPEIVLTERERGWCCSS